MPKSNLMNTYGRFDVTFDRGSGCMLYDTDGNGYLDFVSGVAVNCLGHCHPAIINAITSQSQKLMHISNYYWNENAIHLAEKLIENCDHKNVFFCNSGTEAVEGGIKLARKYGKLHGDKSKLLYMDGSFHGRTMGSLSITGQEKYKEAFKPLIGNVQKVIFNNIDDLREKFDDSVCGIILEPIQGEGGINTVDKTFLKEIESLCTKYDALMIFDEVQCGMGRLGSLFAYKQFGVVPDIICIAKALGGGFPIGAFIANEKASVFVPGDHGNTYGGNPLACAVSLAILNELVDNGIVSSVNGKSNYLYEKLRVLKSKYPVIEDLKGKGLLVGIALNCNTKKFMQKCFENKFLLISAGENVIRLLPPLNVTYDELDEALNILEKVFKEF